MELTATIFYVHLVSIIENGFQLVAIEEIMNSFRVAETACVTWASEGENMKQFKTTDAGSVDWWSGRNDFRQYHYVF
jgi:hypothetical protein